MNAHMAIFPVWNLSAIRRWEPAEKDVTSVSESNETEET